MKAVLFTVATLVLFGASAEDITCKSETSQRTYKVTSEKLEARLKVLEADETVVYDIAPLTVVVTGQRTDLIYPDRGDVVFTIKLEDRKLTGQFDKDTSDCKFD